MLRKALLGAASVLALLAVLGISGAKSAPLIQDAVKSGRVRAEVIFGYAYQPTIESYGRGDTTFSVINETSQQMELKIPTGLLLYAGAGRQDRIVASDQLVSVPPKGTAVTMVRTYCVEAREPISSGEPLMLGSITPDLALLGILEKANAEGWTQSRIGEVQQAIWHLTDDIPAHSPTALSLLGKKGSLSSMGPTNRAAIALGGAAALLTMAGLWAAWRHGRPSVSAPEKFVERPGKDTDSRLP